MNSSSCCFLFSILEFKGSVQVNTVCGWCYVMFIDVWYVMLFDVFCVFSSSSSFKTSSSRRQKVKTSLTPLIPPLSFSKVSYSAVPTYIHIPPRSIYRFEPSQCCVLFVVWQFYTMNAKCIVVLVLLDLYTLWSHLIYSFLLQYPPPVKYSVP